MQIAVLGAGYAGISLVRTLERSLPEEAELTLVDQRDDHLVQHLLHRVISHPELAEQLTIPFSDVLTRATHRKARVADVDPDAGHVELAEGSLDYDTGAVCLGVAPAYYDLPGLREHATPLKRLEHAEAIREEFERVAGGRVLIGGAGLSGVQVAGELAELATDETEIHLLEQEETVAPGFPDRFQRAVADELATRDVTIRTGRSVERATDEAVVLADGTEVAYEQFVWTGGIRGRDALAGRRPTVRADLRLGDRTFGLGDAVRVVDADGTAAPASAQTATRQADVAATNITRLVTHDGSFEPRLARYRYTPRGWLVSVGDGTVAQLGSSVLRGTSARAIKTTVGAGYLSDVGTIQRASEYVREKVA